ncbi:NYN domain-containing protein [Duganella sp. BuS-21]|uniref:NYN domain-containing protein n=1 Tax=Duganella sp. BuS-21 TaxID=2943848 RepID=UPI0035A6DBFD
MASSNENVSMALFCDFENVALGVRDANYDKFDIKPVLERLLLKGSIVVKKAYCDWDRYKSFKAPMHEANFELIEIPHVRQSGKNSADIRMVVDALDLCYTKSHVDTFVIISGDSDFSPLVSKLRENAKKVIGVGVKQSTSDLLVANCDEFIFYDDLVRESRRVRREASPDKTPVKRSPEEERTRREEMEKRRSQAVEIAVDTFEALVLERGDSGKIWASVLKEAIKRRKPDFSESYYGFRTFGNLIEECKARGHLEFGRDEKSGAYVYRGNGVPSAVAPQGDAAAVEGAGVPAEDGQQESRRSRNRGRSAAERFAERQAQRRGGQGSSDTEVAVDVYAEAAQAVAERTPAVAEEAAPVEVAPAAPQVAGEQPQQQKKRNGPKPPARKVKNEAKKGRGPADAASGSALAAATVSSASASDSVAVSPASVPAADRNDAPAASSSAAARGERSGRRPAKQNAGRQHAAKPEGKPEAAPAPAPVADAAPQADKPAKSTRGKPKAKPAADQPVADKPAADQQAADKPAADKPARKPAAARTPRPPKAKPAAPVEE